MKKKSSAQARLRKAAGKEAVVILKKVDRMLKEGVPRAKIERVLSAELAVYAKRIIVEQRIIIPPIGN